MLKRLFVKNLNNKITREINFYPDINIFTGKNGSGKTSILKLCWYLISGNIERIPDEISFDEVILETTDFKIQITKKKIVQKTKIPYYEFRFKIGRGEWQSKRVSLQEIRRESRFVYDANWATSKLRPSIFFSTFRRIEGGFSMIAKKGPSVPGDPEAAHWRSSIQSSLEALSKALSVTEINVFVASISTADLVALLTSKYAELSEAHNDVQQAITDEIFRLAHSYRKPRKKSQASQLTDAKRTLERISRLTQDVTRRREEAFRPFDVLSKLIQGTFQHRGIKITETISLGDAVNAIDSNCLSSGEKQMLGFLCYNSLSSQIPIFIDEPELSLHVDWQRKLFPTLVSQGTNNQFIVATHSPFIYTKYTDREHCLDEDRGGN